MLTTSEGRTLTITLSNWSDTIFYWGFALVLLIVPALTGGDIWDYSTTLFVIVAVVVLLGALTLRRARLTLDRPSATLTIRTWALFIPVDKAHDMAMLKHAEAEERTIHSYRRRRSVGLFKLMDQSGAPFFEFKLYTPRGAENAAHKVNVWLGRA